MSTLPPESQPPQHAAGTDHDALPPGTRFGEFEIQKVLGVGGFGIVYQAWDHSLERQVALKEYMPASLAARGAGPQITVRSASFAETYAIGLRSFVNEARLLARFDHPSLVKVYRFWEDNATAYMVMPFLSGTTLRDTRRRMAHPPDEPWIRSVIAPILSAIELLHREGVYHRDIAPDNILLQPEGPPILLDFGAARRVISDRTQSLTAILKPSYAPIEQYAEMAQMRQGPWTDLYALGAVIHYLLFGAPPSPATARAVQDDSEAIENRVVPGVSPRFMETVAWMLAVRPNQRPQNAEELRRVLDGHANPPPRGRPGITIPPNVANPAGAYAAPVTRPPQPHTTVPPQPWGGPTTGGPPPGHDPTRVQTAHHPTHLPTAQMPPGPPATGFAATGAMPPGRPDPSQQATQVLPPHARTGVGAHPQTQGPGGYTQPPPHQTQAPHTQPPHAQPTQAQPTQAQPTHAQAPYTQPPHLQGGHPQGPHAHAGGGGGRSVPPPGAAAGWPASRPGTLPPPMPPMPPATGLSHGDSPTLPPRNTRPAPLDTGPAVTAAPPSSKTFVVVGGLVAAVVVGGALAWQFLGARGGAGPAAAASAASAPAETPPIAASVPVPAAPPVVVASAPVPAATPSAPVVLPPAAVATTTPLPPAASSPRATPGTNPVPPVGATPTAASGRTDDPTGRQRPQALGTPATQPPGTRPDGTSYGANPNERPRPLGMPPGTPVPTASPGTLPQQPGYGRPVPPTAGNVPASPPPAAANAGNDEANARTVSEACGKRVFIALALCIDEKCEEPRWRNTSECIPVLQRKASRELQGR